MNRQDKAINTPTANRQITFGLIINPWAGVGGTVALKGSDGASIRQEALERGAQTRAAERAGRALQVLVEHKPPVRLLVYAGDMGEAVARQLGLTCEVIGAAQSQPSSAEDTRRAARAMRAQAVDLLVFAGGDGTARDIADEIGESLPVLGIPAGVKMHSGVFAITPEMAGEVLSRVAGAHWTPLLDAEVRDIDEAAFRAGRVASRHYGDMRVPEVPQAMQGSKHSGGPVNELLQLDIAAEVIEQWDDETLYLVGPGSTTQVVLEQMSLPATLLGVDIVLAGQLLAADADAAKIRQLVADHKGPVAILVTAIGGQGHILGRGNQQLTPDIIAQVGRENIQIIATVDKLRALEGRPLRVDTHDPALDTALAGLYSVITAYRQRIMYPLGIETGTEAGAGA